MGFVKLFWMHFTMICIPFVVCYAEKEYRVFTGQDGTEITAKIVEADESHVSVEFRDGRLFKDVPLEKFSREDRDFIHDWVKKQQELIDKAEVHADAKLSINFLRGRDDDKNNYGDIDDRVVRFEPGLVVTSDEVYKTYTGVKGTAVVVGQEIIRDRTYVILSREDFKMRIPPSEKVRWEGKPFRCSYDPDYGGFEYSGYLVVLYNRSGEIVMTKASKSAWEDNPKALLKAKKETGYNSDFSEKHSLYTTFGLP